MGKLGYKNRKVLYNPTSRVLAIGCGSSQLCARASLCPETTDYDNVLPKILVFPCPPDRKLCTNPEGPFLIEYKGYCYRPVYDQDGLLVCTPNCVHDGSYTVYVSNPEAEFRCLPETSCLDSPCADGYHAPSCCDHHQLVCGYKCTCPVVNCRCGKRFLVVIDATEEYKRWNREYVEDYGKLCEHITTRMSAAYVVNFWGSQYGDQCPHYDIRRFGGTYKQTVLDTPCYSEHLEYFEYTPFGGGAPDCGNAWANTFWKSYGTDQNEDGFCNGNRVIPCTADQGGREWQYTGYMDCDGGTQAGYYRQTRIGTCELQSETVWNTRTYVTRLYDCDSTQSTGGTGIGGTGVGVGTGGFF